MFAKSVRGVIYHFALERLPDDSSVMDIEVCFSSVGPDPSRGDIIDVGNADDVIFSIATAFHVRVQLISQSVVNTAPEEGGMDANVPF